MASTQTSLKVVRLLPDPKCVVKVGDGRGFIINQRISLAALNARRPQGSLRLRSFIDRRLIVTAAHCLAESIPAHAMAYPEERTFKRVGTLDARKRNIWAECLFVDPIADIAVLGAPDDQGEDSKQADAYEELTAQAPFLQIGEAHPGAGYVLSLRGRWLLTRLAVIDGIYGTSLQTSISESGMSGSPVLNSRGQAIGVVVVGTIAPAKMYGPQPILTRNLPGWLLPTPR